MGLAFSSDLKYVAMGVQGQPRLLICETETGKLVKSIDGLPGTPVSVAFSPDGKSIAWGTWEGPVHLCDRETGQERRQYDGHRGRVLSLTFTADGQQLVSSSEDSTGWSGPWKSNDDGSPRQASEDKPFVRVAGSRLIPSVH